MSRRNGGTGSGANASVPVMTDEPELPPECVDRQIRVLIVEDHRMFSQALRMALDETDDIAVTAAVATVREGVEAALTAAEVAKLAGSSTVNPSALLNGWVEAKRVFGLTQGRLRLYPAFQIGHDGQPKEQFRTLLTALDGKLDGWPLAIWLTKPNAEFDGWATPLDIAPLAMVVAPL